MDMFSTPVLVDMHDVDINGVARASSMLRYFQIAANHQLATCGMTYDSLKEQKRAFILSRIQMEFTESPRAYTHLTAKTAPCESRGFRFLRCYELMRADALIGRAVSVWALIDTDSHALIRTSEFHLPLSLCTPPTALPVPIRFPSSLMEVGQYTVTYAELDQNGHMNNTHYPDIYANFLPMTGMRIASLSISYAHEVRGGQTLRVLRAQDGDRFYFQTLLPDGTVNSEAELRLVPIS